MVCDSVVIRKDREMVSFVIVLVARSLYERLRPRSLPA
jgi:hypothetical protein